ncbi:MAG: HPr family phosphocarrier protein [Gammaproteobacteria bacterium]
MTARTSGAEDGAFSGLEVRLRITNPTGLHARPAVKLAQLAARFKAEVWLRVDEQGTWVRAKSTAKVMKLKARANSLLCVRADGEQAEAALAALSDFIRRDFDEGPGSADPDHDATARVNGGHELQPNELHPGSYPADSLPANTARHIPAQIASPGLALGLYGYRKIRVLQQLLRQPKQLRCHRHNSASCCSRRSVRLISS